MKKLMSIALMLCFTALIVSSALALRWPNNMSRRVASMGGAGFGIEDETTALTVFNHQNIAGVALNKKENRIDLAVDYISDYYKDETSSTSFGTTTTTTNERSFTTMQLTRPGGEYRGVTYWLDDNLAIRGGIEGLSIGYSTEGITETDDGTTTTTTTQDDTFSALGIGGGASISYKTDSGLALGAGLSYKGAGGEPGDLNGAFDMYGGGQTTSLEMSMTNLEWAVSAAYEMLKVGSEDNKLTFGLTLHADDDMPNVGALLSGSSSAMYMGDYSVVQKAEGNITGLGAVTNTYTYTMSPFVISGEAIFNLGSMLEAGLLLDYKMTSMNTKTESTGYPSGFSTDVDYKNAEYAGMGITPVVQGKMPVSQDMNILAGLMLTTWGSGKYDNYALDTSTSDVNDTYKNDVNEIGSTIFAIGAGMQAMKNALNIAVQYETGGVTVDDTNYNVNGDIVQQMNNDGDMVDSIQTKVNVSNIRFGGEYWVMPMLAIRAGYAILASTTEEGYYNSSSGNFEDLTTTTGRLTFGAGVMLPQGTTFDLLIQMDTETDDPETPNLDVTDTETTISVSTKIIF